MIVLHKLSVRGYRSFGDDVSVVTLDTPGLILLTGENRDRGVSSGAGKSSLIKAICTALFEQNDDESIKRRGENVALQNGYDIVVEFSNGVNQYYTRYSYTKGKTEWGVYLWNPVLSSWVDVCGERQSDTGKIIESIIGMDYNQFMGQAYMSQDRVSEFIFRSQKERIDIFSRVLGLDQIDRWVAAAREYRRRYEQKIQIGEGRLQALKNQWERVNAALQQHGDVEELYATVQLKRSILQTLEEKIRAYDACLPLVQEYMSIKAKLSSEKERLGTVIRHLDRLQPVDMESAEENFRLAREHVDCIRGELRAAKSLVQDYEHRLSVLSRMDSKCFYCGQTIPKNIVDRRIDEIKTSIANANIDIRKHESDLGHASEISRQWEQYVVNAKYIHAQRRSLAEEKDRLISVISSIESDFDKIKNKIIQQSIDPDSYYNTYHKIQDQVVEIQGDIVTVESTIRRIEELKNQQEEIAKEIEQTESGSVQNQEIVQYYTKIENILGDRGFRNHKIASCQEFFNVVLNNSLNILTDGELSANLVSQVPTADKKGNKFYLDILVSEHGKENVPIRQYSGGERATLSLAITRSLWELSSSSKGVNVLLLDEPFANMDSWQIQRACALLEEIKKSCDRTIIVITNDASVRELGKWDREIIAIKENHITKIHEIDLSGDH